MKPQLSSDIALVDHSDAGPARDRDELIMRYGGLVRSIASRYVNRVLGVAERRTVVDGN